MPLLNKNLDNLLSFSLIAKSRVREAVMAVNILVTTPIKNTKAKPLITAEVAKK